MPFIKSVLKQLAKSVLILLGLTAAAAVTDVAIHKKNVGFGNTKLTNSNENMNDIMKIVKLFEESGLSTKSFGEAIRNEGKNKEEDISEGY